MSRSLSVVALIALSVPGCAAPTTSGAPGSGTTAPTATYTPGVSYFGTNNYIEYAAGNAPVILTAPHGGALLPSSIPDRTPAACGGSATTVTDVNTIDLARAMQQSYFARFGKYPHVIVNNLSRRKLDPNRRAEEAACANAAALAALWEWHSFIDIAKKAALAASGKAWYMDMHGHGHANQRLELGYLLTSAQLNLPDAVLDATVALEDTSSIRTVSQASPLSFSQLLRGSASLGTLYAANGFPAVPTSTDPGPGAEAYFSGGDNTRRHTCGAEATSFGGTTGGQVCGVQIEANFTGVRDNAANRTRFGDVTARVLQLFLATHWGLQLQ